MTHLHLKGVEKDADLSNFGNKRMEHGKVHISTVLWLIKLFPMGAHDNYSDIIKHVYRNWTIK